MNLSPRDRILWLLVLVFAAFAVAKTTLLATHLQGLIPAISILIPTAFAIIHGGRRLGARTMWVLFAITFVVSWCYESLSIATGFPFGHYHYTAKLGPRLGEVPLLIMPAYFAVCYLSWNLAHIVLDKFNQTPDKLMRFALPVLASFIMVMWDMSMDPARATVSQAWIWHDGGGYFGVPFSNFMGWYLCVYTIFQLLAVYLLRPNASTPRNANASADDTQSSWHLVTAFYAATFLEFLALGLNPPQGTVADATGQVWGLAAMYESLGLVALFTMGFVSVLAFLKVQAQTQLK